MPFFDSPSAVPTSPTDATIIIAHVLLEILIIAPPFKDFPRGQIVARKLASVKPTVKRCWVFFGATSSIIAIA